MKPNDKVKVISSTFSMFDVGSIYDIHSVIGALVYLIDPFYIGDDESDLAIWPFLEDELELVL